MTIEQFQNMLREIKDRLPNARIVPSFDVEQLNIMDDRGEYRGFILLTESRFCFVEDSRVP